MLLAAGCGRTGASSPTNDPHGPATPALPVVQVAAVRTGAIEQTLPLTGTLQALPNQQVTLRPPVAGILEQFPIHYGEAVRRGQVIAQLSTQQIQGQVLQAQATLAQVQVKVQQAEASALRQQAQTRVAIEQAQATASSAEATLDQAEATQVGKQATMNTVEIASGLAAGEQVAVSGQYGLPDGT